MISDWKSDLLKEKTLGEVYFESRKLSKSRINRRIYIASLTFLVIISAIFISQKDIETSARATLVAADLSFLLTVTVLGFLIAGFSIFATLSSSKTMKLLASIEMDGTGLSIFKSMFFNFLSVFYIYVGTLGAAVVIKIASSISGASIYRHLNGEFLEISISIINGLSFAVICFLLIYCIVRIKSFIWSIYQSYLTVIMTEEQ